MTANLRKFFSDDEIHTIAARVEQPEDGSPHFYVSAENTIVMHVRTLHHDIPVEANFPMQPGVWSVPDVGTEVMLASDYGKFEGELYVTGTYSRTNTPSAEVPDNLSPANFNVAVVGDARIRVGSGHVVKMTSSDITEKTMRGETYRNAESAFFSALDTLVNALAVMTAALSTAAPTFTGGPVAVAAFATAVTNVSLAATSFATAVTTFNTGAPGYLTTVLEVE